MVRHLCLATSLLLLLGGQTACAGAGEPGAPASPPAPRPHVVLILADDLGWGDVGYHGSAIRTPSIDRLARQGVRLEQFYAMQTCTPSRAALLTGRHPIRYGLQIGIVWRKSDYGLPAEERTLAEALGETGYRTAMVGKWHLGHAGPAMRPLGQGFASHYGSYLGAGGYFSRRRGPVPDWWRDEQPLQEEGYTTELLVAEAERIILGHDPATPLFLYVAFKSPHMPLEAPEKHLAMYQDVEDEDRRTYAAMVSCLDDAVGRILEALRQRGMREETLVVFLSDNGAAEYHAGSNAPLRDGKRSLYEGGLRVPAVALWPGRLEGGRVIEEPVHIIDWYPTLVRLAGGRLEQPRPLDGMDIWPTLAEGEPSPHTELLLNIYPPGIGAIRQQDWKLLVDEAEEPPRLELYDLARDPGEARNVAAEHPDVVGRLRKRLDQYEEEALPSIPREVRAEMERAGRAQGREEGEDD